MEPTFEGHMHAVHVTVCDVQIVSIVFNSTPLTAQCSYHRHLQLHSADFRASIDPSREIRYPRKLFQESTSNKRASAAVQIRRFSTIN